MGHHQSGQDSGVAMGAVSVSLRDDPEFLTEKPGVICGRLGFAFGNWLELQNARASFATQSKLSGRVLPIC
jgi:hypothetical protein